MTLILIVITAAVSLLCFSNSQMFQALQFNAWYMARRGTDNIGHSAHFWGAIYGLLFPLLLAPHTLLHFLGQLGIMP